MDSALRTELRSYHRASRTATYGFLAALPLLIAYEVGIVLVGGDVRVGADVWMKMLLGLFGGTGWALMGVVVAGIGFAVMWAERHRRPPLKGRFFGWLLLESLFYAIVLAMIVSTLVGILLMMGQTPFQTLPLTTQLALSFGAGLYEELVFRVLLVGGMFLGLRRVMRDRRHAYGIAAVVGALIFSAVHYIGVFGDPFTLGSFTYRFLFGLALNGVFLLRGFAAAAWTHALYDVLVVLRLL